jgi:hypothetical protein
VSRPQLIAYRIFVVALGVWTGSGIHDTIQGHWGWYHDPVEWIRTSVAQAGSINPWPITSALLLLATLAALGLSLRYRGPGRRDALIPLLGTLAIIVVTLAYFVPMLGKLADPASLSDAEIISDSRTWIVLNIIRQLILVALFYRALVALGRFGMAGSRG